MYVEPLLTIGKVENGFVITVTAPMKRESGSNEPSVIEDRDKSYIVDDLDALATKLKTVIPMLEQDDDTSMMNAFKEALKND